MGASSASLRLPGAVAALGTSLAAGVLGLALAAPASALVTARTITISSALYGDDAGTKSLGTVTLTRTRVSSSDERLTVTYSILNPKGGHNPHLCVSHTAFTHSLNPGWAGCTTSSASGTHLTLTRDLGSAYLGHTVYVQAQVRTLNQAGTQERNAYGWYRPQAGVIDQYGNVGVAPTSVSPAPSPSTPGTTRPPTHVSAGSGGQATGANPLAAALLLSGGAGLAGYGGLRLLRRSER